LIPDPQQVAVAIEVPRGPLVERQERQRDRCYRSSAASLPPRSAARAPNRRARPRAQFARASGGGWNTVAAFSLAVA